MRRTEREITERQRIDDILHQATVVYLAMVEEGNPHVVPLNFGYDGTALYLHSALEGRKIEILRRNPRVSFALHVDDAIIPGEVGCAWSARYRSVMGEGKVVFLETPEERRYALDTILGKFAAGPLAYLADILARTAVLRVEITSISGKQAGY